MNEWNILITSPAANIDVVVRSHLSYSNLFVVWSHIASGKHELTYTHAQAQTQTYALQAELVR